MNTYVEDFFPLFLAFGNSLTGASQCLGELYRNFGRRITSGLLETTNIAAKLIRFNEVSIFGK